MSDRQATPTERSPEERKKLYKKSLNLPRTPFPMRANLAQNEPQSLKRWQTMGLYEKALEARAGGEPFVFHDGPPYANGSIHVGHLLNRVLKDIVVRSRQAAGRPCPFIPGWDCHGLPIEHRVMTDLVESGKIDKLLDLPEDTRRMAVRRECQRTAEKYVKLQADQMQRLLTLADYDDPYVTMRPPYEAAVLEVFAEMVEQGLVYRALKPVHWSIANETALAEAELEYRDRDDPAVHVRFDAVDPAAVAGAFGLATDALDGADDRPGFVIWTTTPWTLPANLLIAVGEGFRYVLARLGGRPVVVARKLLEAVATAAGEDADAVEILAETDGAALVGLVYEHPFMDRTGRLVAGEHVTLEDGTGLVHTAPGHGPEDFALGQREGVEVYSPVRGDGTFDDTVPAWIAGQSVWAANDLLIDHLRGSGHLLAAEVYHHSYPHDWRSKTPVVFRCTEQWFVAVDEPTERDGASLREMGLAACRDDVSFVPGWGVKRLGGMLESRPDWCISRQRAWGLPIPAFRTPDGGVLLTPATVRAVATVVEREGSDAWFTEGPEHLLAAWDPSADPDAPEGLDADAVARLEKMHDIFDVWFESGSSWHAVMRRRDQGFPVDLYLEGSDQHRGWFQLALLTSLGATGRAPYRTLLTHGFMVDKDGRKMSKSLGNTLEVDDLLAEHGADVCRWWVSSLAFENDIKVDKEFFVRAGESYRKVRNTLRFLLSNLSDFDRDEHGVDLADLDPRGLDARVLEAASALRETVLGAYERYELRPAHRALFDFCNDTLSAFYLDATKDRLYCDRPDSDRRRASQTAIWHLTELLTTLLAPLLPHTADEAYRVLHGVTGDAGGGQDPEGPCVHLVDVPELSVSADPAWSRVLQVRQRALKALEESDIENNVDAGLVVPDPDGVLAPFADDLADVFGVSRVRLDGDAGADAAIEILDLRDEPRCERSWRRDETVAQRADGGWLSDRDAEAVGLI